jgi:hypothetical protein
MPSLREIGRALEEARQAAASKVADAAEAAMATKRKGPAPSAAASAPSAPASATEGDLERGARTTRNIGDVVRDRGKDAGYKRGGTVRSSGRGDGAAKRGKTRGKFI